MRNQTLAILFSATISAACTSGDATRDTDDPLGQHPPSGGPEDTADAATTIICTEPDCEGETVEGVPGSGHAPEDQGPPLLPPDEIPCDGLDQDGDGNDLCETDADADGFGSNDCDDSDPEVHWGADEVWCDGVDQNCNGFDECDQDADGVVDTEDCAPSEAHAPCQDEPDNESSN